MWGSPLPSIPARTPLPARTIGNIFRPASHVCRHSQSLPSEDPDALLEKLMPGSTRIRQSIGDKHAAELSEIAASYGNHDIPSWEALTPSERISITNDLLAQVVARETDISAAVQEAFGSHTP